jgi:immunity protein 7 of polymorphic toxin system
MYTFHMWLVLSDSTSEDDFSIVQAKLRMLRPLLEERFSWAVVGAPSPVFVTNGLVTINASLCTNHTGATHSELLDTLDWIGRELPGSYGVVYWSDDEDPAMRNQFGVIVMTRGKVHHRSDPFLSPQNPVIED